MELHKPTERVVKILLTLSQHEDGLNLTQLSNKTEIPKGTISPILRTLRETNFIHSNGNGLYKIGRSAFVVGETFIKSMTLYDVIIDNMKEIVDKCNEICQLGVYNGDGNILYIAKIDPVQSIRLESSVGKVFPAYSTALGKSLLTNFTSDEIRNIYDENRPLEKMTDNTITDIDDLISEIDRVRGNNYSEEAGEATDRIECIAVPLKSRGEIFASISISMPFFRATEEKKKEVIDLLLSYKTQIETKVDLLEIDVLAEGLI